VTRGIRERSKPLGALFGLLLLLACETAGKDFDAEKAKQVRKGMTQAEVIELLESKPDSQGVVMTDQGEMTTLVWSYTNLNSISGNELKSFAVTIDKDGRVFDYTRSDI
jgi:hypothetical protein